HGDGGGGGIGSPPSAVRVKPSGTGELGPIGGGGGIGSPPSAGRVRPSGTGELGPIGGGIGSPPSASSALARLGESAEWCVVGPSETATNANTTNKLIFRKLDRKS